MLKKPEKCIKTPIENCNPTTEVALMCITYSWYVDGVMYQEIFQSSEDTSGLCANEKGMFFNFLATFKKIVTKFSIVIHQIQTKVKFSQTWQ